MASITSSIHPGAEEIVGPEHGDDTSMVEGLPPLRDGKDEERAVTERQATAQDSMSLQAELADRDLEREQLEQDIREQVVDEATLKKRQRVHRIGGAALAAGLIGLAACLGLRETNRSSSPNLLPFNDKCANARQVDDFPFALDGDITDATTVESVALACPAVTGTDHGVWSQLTGSASPNVCLDATVVGSNFTSYMSVCEGTGEGLLCHSTGRTQSDTIGRQVLLPPGRRTYFLLVSGESNSVGSLELHWSSKYHTMSHRTCLSLQPNRVAQSCVAAFSP